MILLSGRLEEPTMTILLKTFMQLYFQMSDKQVFKKGSYKNKRPVYVALVVPI